VHTHSFLHYLYRQTQKLTLDTYLDCRNGYIFEVGALGTQDDALFTDESLDRPDWNWDGVFTTETTVNAEGWVLEMVIPFTIGSLDIPTIVASARGVLKTRSDPNSRWSL
jgi:hypothetical protein